MMMATKNSDGVGLGTLLALFFHESNFCSQCQFVKFATENAVGVEVHFAAIGR